MVAVVVLPLILEQEYQPLPEAELEITCTTGTGPGGQHGNKTASCVRAKHKPTGMMVTIDRRDQHQNRRDAIRILTSRVHQHYRERDRAGLDARRRAQWAGGGRGDNVRTYNFIESRVVDHRLGTKTRNVKEVMKGNLRLILR